MRIAYIVTRGDDIGGAQLATRHLLEHGHPYVACLGGPASTPDVGDPVTDHVEGWRRAMREAGRSTEGRLFQAPYNRYDAYEVALRLLSGEDRPPGNCASTCRGSWRWPASTTSRKRR